MDSRDSSYSTKITVRSSEERAFEALSTHIGEWWGDQDKPAKHLGDVFTMSWGEPWYKFKVVAYVPNQEIIWKCIDAKQIIGELEGVEKEWVGTQLQWKIHKLNDQEVELQFKHEGLVHEFICYDFCSNTWDRFIDFSLKKYLEQV